MLSKKTYIVVAEALGKFEASNGLVSWFCDYFKSDNFRFQRETFQEAVAAARK